MISGDSKSKWSFPIPYFVDVGVSPLLIDSALFIIQNKTCIKFKKYKVMLPHLAGLRYYYGNDCSSPVGQQGKGIWQPISIGPNCDFIGKVIHETMHSLGFFHTQARHDRDLYLYFKKENIEKNFYKNFLKVHPVHSNTFGVSFDFGSVMLYGMKMYSKNGKETMLSRDPLYKYTYGLSEKLSFCDVKMLNYYYCSDKCRIKIYCKNGGYQDPNNCRVCKCVKGFIGRFCNKLSFPTNECGPSRLYATNKIKEFMTKGKKNCIYHILTSKQKRIVIKVLSSNFYPNSGDICYSLNSLEVKYWNDKAATGARFCLYKTNFFIYSNNHHAMILFRSNSERNHCHILYKSVPKYFDHIKLEKEFLNYKRN
uniref:Metalloendopeptidase n=1 Tax=Strongyloides stercoralis TaxID=6248 RepID=A0A0K0DV89_STRER